MNLGLLTAKANGEVAVKAVVDQIPSLAKVFRIGMPNRVGLFSGIGSYDVEGRVTLYKNAR